jgi:hypothetical protein
MKASKLKISILCMLSILIAFGIEKIYYSDLAFSFDRFIIFIILLLFISLHFIFDIKKIWRSIHKKRYILGAVIYVFLIVNSYHGSSISFYNQIIQPEYQVEDGNPIFGESRLIRADEWAVTTPMILSQTAEINSLGKYNHNIMGISKPITLYFRLPARDITMLSNPAHIPFYFLPVQQAFSAYWYFGLFTLFFASYEFIMIITKKKVYAAFGAIMIALAPATRWWDSANILSSGLIAVICFYYYLRSNNIYKKIGIAAVIGIAGSTYVMTVYPPWLIPYGYFFFMIVIYFLYENKGYYNWKTFLILVPVTLAVMLIILLPSFIIGREVFGIISETAYPGARISTGGYGWESMFDYLTNFFTPFKSPINASEMSQFICFYPVPMFMGAYYIFQNYKNKKQDLLLQLLVGLSIFLSIWNFIKLPEIVAKITMLSMSTVERANVVLGFVNLLIMIICLANYNEDKKSILMNRVVIAAVSAVTITSFGVYLMRQQYADYFSFKITVVAILVFVVFTFLIILNNKKTNLLLISTLGLSTLVSGLAVQPLNKGINVFYDKPVMQEVTKLVNEDSEAGWMTISTPYFIQNYLLVSGARVINSTNYFPNFDLWDQLDENRSQEFIYNRYAHITVNLVNEETNMDIRYEDHIDLHLNINDLEKTGVKYLVSYLDGLESYSTEDVTITQTYGEFDIYIYEVSYLES